MPIVDNRLDPRSVPIVDNRLDPRSVPIANNRLDPRSIPIIDNKPDPRSVPIIDNGPHPRAESAKHPKRTKRPEKASPASIRAATNHVGRRPRRSAREEKTDTFLGRVLDGTYRINRVIGAGGMAVVYGATDLSLDREVAIKVLNEQYCGEPKYRRRFRIEAKTVAKIQHPNLVQIYGCRIDGDEIPYIVMELLEGKDLQEEISHIGRMGWTRAVALMIQICGAVEAAHRQGVIHRDIKPANCFLVAPRPRDALRGEVIKLLDLGIAKLMKNQEVTETTTPKTVEGAILGTWPYMAPEQIEQEPVPQTDVYALGAVLYRLITGRHPIQREGASDQQLIFRILNEVPRSPARLVSDLPPRLSALIQQALSKPIADRPQSVAELRNALVDCLRSAAAQNGEHAQTRAHLLPRMLFFGTAMLSSLGLLASVLMLVHLSRPARAAMPPLAPVEGFPHEATTAIVGDSEPGEVSDSVRSPAGGRETNTEPVFGRPTTERADHRPPPIIEAPSRPSSANSARPSEVVPERREQRQLLQRELRKQNSALTSACPINFRIKTEIVATVDIKVKRGRATVAGVSASPTRDIMSCINNQLEGRVIPGMLLGGRYPIKLTLHGE